MNESLIFSSWEHFWILVPEIPEGHVWAEIFKAMEMISEDICDYFKRSESGTNINVEVP